MAKCKLCVEQGWPEHFGSEPCCAFEAGEFSSDNWNCATANAIRRLMGEGDWGDKERNDEAFYVRRDDQSYGALFVPPNPERDEDEGPWQGGGLIAGYWYKHRGQTEMLIRVDPRNGGMEQDAAKPLTLEEAEEALECCLLARKD